MLGMRAKLNGPERAQVRTCRMPPTGSQCLLQTAGKAAGSSGQDKQLELKVNIPRMSASTQQRAAGSSDRLPTGLVIIQGIA